MFAPMSGTYEISFSPIRPSDEEAVARLLHRSLAHWYQTRLGLGGRYGTDPAPMRLFPQVYEALDPGECVLAREKDRGELAGVCFSHERETHVAVGIVATAPEAGGKGVARRMMELVLEKARSRGKPARLVSSLLNLDSFSLYTRVGFVPGAIFQDLMIEVPAGGLKAPEPPGVARVRPARPDEAARIAGFEQELQGVRREKDFQFFLRNEVGSWRVLVAEGNGGSLAGFLGMSLHPWFGMIGPGVAVDEETAAALLWRALEEYRGRSILFLLPCLAAGLVQTAYRWGARNVEMHVHQCTAGAVPGARGIVFPSFLPETA